MHGIARQTDYAARIILYLAGLGPDVRVSIKEIADARLLPLPYVRRVIAKLASDELLTTTRGQGGGVSLARPAAEITLLDVVNVMDGGVVLNRCVDEPETCPLAVDCPVHAAWEDATRSVESHLATVTFADLLADQADGRIAG